LGGKHPERDFFFGIICTLKNGYMKEIIEEANKKRFKLDKDDESKEGIVITENWFKELTKHPYYSSKIIAPQISLEKPGTGIFLMRERAKLYKGTRERKKHTLSKRLSD